MVLNQLADIVFIVSAVVGVVTVAIVVPAILGIARNIRQIKELL